MFSSAVVILVPTRELALQTSQVCKELGKHLQIQVMVTTGGTSLKDDIMRLYQPVHLLVGTPGRILDLAKKGVCILKDCSMLVMDEVNTYPQLPLNLRIERILSNSCWLHVVILIYLFVCIGFRFPLLRTIFIVDVLAIIWLNSKLNFQLVKP